VRRIAEATTYGKFLADASVGTAVVIDPMASTHPVEDEAFATHNMLLAAHALGLGACWIGSYNEESVPKNKRLLSIISIGFPAESPTKTRKELREIMFTDRYVKK
jgi:nitroreductase